MRFADWRVIHTIGIGVCLDLGLNFNPQPKQEPDPEESNQSPTNIPEILAAIGVASGVILLIYLIIRRQKVKI